MATIRDVARCANTSIAAVSATLNGRVTGTIRVGAQTRARIEDAARQLGYSPNSLARSLALRRTGVLGLVFPYSQGFVDKNPFFSQIMAGVFEAAVETRCNLMLHTALGDDWNAADETALIDARVDGLLLVLPTPNSPVIARCRRERFPYVALGYAAESDATFSVNADDLAGGRLATEHLLRLGHRRIAHFVGDPKVATTTPRLQGYQEAMAQAGVAVAPEWVVPAGFDNHGGYQAMQRLLELPARNRPTAVFAANDLSADAARRAIQEVGLRIPEDIALVGFDDTWFAALLDPPLTSVHMPIAEMGSRSVHLLLAQINNEEILQRQITLPVWLTARQSCGTPLFPKGVTP